MCGKAYIYNAAPAATLQNHHTASGTHRSCPISITNTEHLTSMMLRKVLFRILTLLLLTAGPLQAQVYTMGNGTVNTCSGFFYDSGGSGGDYFNNENYTLSICASTPGTCVRLNFTSFDLEPTFDEMMIYNGPSTAAPLIGTFTGNVSPGLITGSSGCLTIVFTSDAIVRYTGWSAEISCVNCSNGSCLSNCNGGAAPANDACTGAQNLGSIPAPAPCPGGIGGLSTTNTSNLCATAEFPYSSLLGCQPSGNMATPAADVWYRFNITGPSLNVNISGGLANPNVGLYEGSSCASLIPRGCAIGNNGNLNATFSGLAAGTYYLQVSGGSVTDQCDFTLTLQNNYDCAGCVIQSNFTAVPPPVNGFYPAGQTVTFCYTITDYNQTSANWLHGIVPDFGPGWDMSTFVAGSTTNCSGQGTWNWYNSNVTSSATGNVSGPGFYYESPLGNPSGLSDGNPGNNFGDNNGTNTCDWTFCWTIQTLPASACIQGASLNISVDTYGDGESGSWGSVACTQDPVTSFYAALSCCEAPVINVTNPQCPGQNTGSATAQGAGNGPWDYVWQNAVGGTMLSQSNIAGSSTINNLPPGNYTIRVTDNTGCTANAAFTVTAAPAFTASINTTNLTCNGSNNGSASVIVNGGSPGYSYSWLPSGSGSNPTSLPAGNYTVTVTDANGCTTTASGSITQPNQLLVSIGTQNNITCNGGQDGSITVSASGGTPGYAYTWSNGTAGTSVSGLSAGAYTVTVTDSRGCTGFMTVVLSQPAALALNLSSTTASCGNANGTATVIAAGGVPAYTYAWSPSGGSGNIASGLTAGGYNVTVTDSRGCTAIGNVVVSNSSGPTAGILSSNNVSCFGGTDGSATVSVTGSSGAVTYSWAPSGGNAATASGLAAGNYTVTVNDASGCSSSASVVITSPPQLTATITASIPVSCSNENDGSLTVQANGGTPGYSYQWSGGSVNPTDNLLSAGSYTVTITDASGCTATATGTVNAPPALQLNVTANNPASCAGGNDGSATVAAAGGTPAYSYQWSNGNTSAGLSALAAGTYTATVTDANGCTSTAQVNIGQAGALVLNLSSTSTSCGNNNGSATVLVNGGTPAYSYTWNPTGGTANTASGLGSGNYTVIVTDANGCTTAGNINVPSANGPGIVLNSSTDISCPGGSDGSIDVSVNGGVTPYNYTWSNGAAGNILNNLAAGTYILTITDDNNCTASLSVSLTAPQAFAFVTTPVTAHCGQADGSLGMNVSGGTAPYTYLWSNGAGGSLLTNIGAGTYTLTVSDANGCSAQAQGTVPDEPAPVLSINNILDATCAGASDGRIRVNVAGGIPPYTYAWSNGTIGQLNANIPAGTYTVTVMDDFGCTSTLQASVNEPPALVLVTGSTSATCGASNGSANVLAAGGTAPYQYNWVPAGGSGASALNLGAGAYTVVVTDDNGCTEQASVTVPSSNGPSAAVLLSTDVSCSGGNDGSLTIAVNGGVAPYNYQWSSGGSGVSGNNLTAGTYTITVSDANNCSATVAGVINEPPAINMVLASFTAHCGQADGSADAQVNGGVPPYSYTWSTGTSVNNILPSVAAGTYTVTVTDANGCTGQSSVLVSDKPGPAVNVAGINNATCNGGSNGSIAVGLSGGSAPFAYTWSNGTSGAVNSNLAAGTYTVTVSDAFGCTGTVSGTVNDPPAIQLNFNNTTSTCGFSNGSASVTPAGGSAPYTYLWNNGAVVSGPSALAAGIYTVTVTDAQGCSVSGSTIVNSAGGPTLAAGPLTDVSCAGGADGTATVLVIAGNGPYTFDWLPYGGITASANGLSAGNYKVTVTDVNGCSTALNFDILEPTPLVVNNLCTPVSCNAGADGTATIDAQGGTAPYTYDWNPGGLAPANRINLSAGTYTVTVSDSKGCTMQTQAIVSEPTAITGVLSVADATCNGGSDGSVSIVAAGGLTPYTFLWSDGSTGTQISNLAAGAYSITIYDNNGCSHAENALVAEPAAISLNITVNDASCGNANGNAQVSGSGGTGNLSYQWSNGSGSNSISALTAGNYTVIATDDNGCTVSGNALVSDLGGPSLSLFSANDVSCNGGSDGTAEVSVNAGNGPFAFQWLPAGGSNVLATGLSAGAYTVNVTDANGCVSSINVNIIEPAALSLQTNSTQATCGNANGSAAVLANGGTAPYTYAWSNGDNTATASLLAAGTYNVTVTDAKGCSSAASATVQQPSGLSLQTSATAATCNGGNDGSALVNVNGGTAPYSYLWSNGAVTAQLNNLNAGSYTVTVTDDNGCSYTDNIAVSEAGAIVLQVLVNDATCGAANGSAVVTGNGGTGSLAWTWSGGQSSNSINNLAAGSYTVTATDANGCSSSTVAAVGNLGGPQAAIQTVSDVRCNGGSDGAATAVVNAGNGPYSYQWIPSGGNALSASGLSAGNYTLAVTDANGCISNLAVSINEPAVLSIQPGTLQATCGNTNGSISTQVSGGTGTFTYLWSDGSNGNGLSQIAAGSYTVTVTDANNCSASATAVVANAGGPVLAVSNVSAASCYGSSDGSAGILISSGNAPFNYNWSPSGGTAANANGLAAGTYTVAVTDINGCVSQQAIVIQEPTALSIQSSTNPTQCNASNGTASVQVSGGTGNYSYTWSTGATGAQLNGLNSGNYTVLVTDANACTASEVLVVGGLPGPGISAVTTTDATCFGDANGSAQVQFSSGTAPFSYAWSNGSAGAGVNGLPAGNYTVTVTDVFGCSDARVFSIQQPAILSAQAQPLTMVSCFGGSDGTAGVQASGGTAPYSYQWSSGTQSQTATGLSAGTYTVLISDQHGCSDSRNVTILQPALLTLTQQSISSVSCYGGSNGSAGFQAGGGTAPYQYTWSNGSSSAAANNLAAGSYTLTLSDARGCSTMATLLITQPAELKFNTATVTGVSCYNGNNGQISVSNYGGVAPYAYQWSNGSSGAVNNNLPAGTFTVTVTDANGCTELQSATVAQPPALAIQSTLNPIPCYGMANASVVVNASGGVAPYAYAWNNGSVSNSITSLPPGVYTVLITDANNCLFDTSFSITQPPLLQALVNQPDTLCIGQVAVLNALTSGGTAPYTYQWNNNAGGSSLPVSPAISTSYTLLVSDANGCTYQAPAVYIPVFPALSLSMSVSDDTLCEGESTSLVALAGGGNGGPYTYTWNAIGNNVAGFSSSPDSSYLYTVSISDGCTVLEPLAQQLVVVNPLPQVSFTPLYTEGCNPVTVQFSSTSQTTAGSVYTWDFGDGNDGSGSPASHTYHQDGMYDVNLQVTDANGCSSRLTQNNVVNVFPLPVAFYTSDPQEVSVLHPVVQFINGSSGAFAAHWDFGDGSPGLTEWSPEHTFGDTGRYKVELIVISNEGCVDTFYNEIIVKGETTFYVPNAFTPNNDGDNETFTGYGIGIQSADFFIFDRWGKMIYQSNSLDKGWNGTYQNNGDPCPEGTYVYLFKVFNGQAVPLEFSGRVTLVR
ncbi:MAG: gliding motility-associated C-terminal domain-containing protein [Bacteroidia bacterium]|nr:gliding motility-associated C-terminal domain-containing protein [Bacteroidia bacterium]